MSRIDLARLDDLEDVLSEVRSWPRIEDRGGGTFYLGRKPYLHFHVGHDTRRADVRRADGWSKIDLPEPITVPAKQELLHTLRAEHADRVAVPS